MMSPTCLLFAKTSSSSSVSAFVTNYIKIGPFLQALEIYLFCCSQRGIGLIESIRDEADLIQYSISPNIDFIHKLDICLSKHYPTLLMQVIFLIVLLWRESLHIQLIKHFMNSKQNRLVHSH